MDLILLITGLLSGAVLTYLILTLLHKSKHVARTDHELLKTQLNNSTTQVKVAEDRLLSQQQLSAQLQLRYERGQMEIKELQANNIALETNEKNKTEKIAELNNSLLEQTNNGYTLQNTLQELNKKLTEVQVLNRSLQDQLELQKTNIQQLTTQLTQQNERNQQLYADNSAWKANNTALNERLANQKEEIIELQKTAHLQFEKIAQQIFEDKSGKFTATNKANIEALLKPLGENIDLFKKKVEETYDKESKQRFSLEEKVKELVEQTNKVSSEANNLASALKGQSKKQGNWGEVILESILQKSGLVKNREYFLQQTIKDEDGRSLRPDVLIKLPDNRIIIIDSKVSLVAYDRFSAADNAEQQAIHLGEHLKSVYTHIDELSSKQYDNLDAALDFTMMFVPIEPAYLVSIQADQDLWAYAYAKRILLVSPTNLIACLKLMADLWKREMQSKNALEIVKRGELLYEKFTAFASTLEELGRQINKTQQSYTTAIGQLNTGNGHLIGQALKLKNLGLKSNKEIPPALLPTDFEPEPASPEPT